MGMSLPVTLSTGASRKSNAEALKEKIKKISFFPIKKYIPSSGRKAQHRGRIGASLPPRSPNGWSSSLS